ncbi:ABC transporter ATP-binding protein [Gleimia hominis]|uniref:ABC transporter ATP-binding protein n=1 Tax=Gleimia hominis TaxID=595468 RepID=A0ABU3I933_9ACTO|nr:ABC transporter ATP-binding protein [Gleimia hominis]MDT3766889.1 ABC transporter ATP-binding protein [Gleimia hominis]
MANLDPIISVQNLQQKFSKNHVLNDVSLSIRAGESVAISGSSGSGKTTLLGCIMGLIQPTSGDVTVAGQDMRKLSRAKGAAFRNHNIGIVFQNGELIEELTAEENVALPTLMNKKDKSVLERASEYLRKLKVPVGRPVYSLSGGEAQRVAFARATFNRPPVILADEPTANLDPELRDELCTLLFENVRASNSALVLVSHDPVVNNRAGRHYVLNHGKLTKQ